MKIYKLTQSVNCDYDTYDSIVVVAEDEKDAITIHPDTNCGISFKDGLWHLIKYNGEEIKSFDDIYHTWVSIKDLDKIKVEYIGEASDDLPRGVILASFNAG